MGDYRDVKKRLSALAVAGLLLFATYGNDFITIAEGENSCTNFVDENSWDADGTLIVDDGGNSVPDGICDNCGRDLASHSAAAEPAVEEVQEENTEEAAADEEAASEITDENAQATEDAAEESAEETNPEEAADEANPEENPEEITCEHIDEDADGICDLCNSEITEEDAEDSESDPAEEESTDQDTITVEETVIVEGDENCDHTYEYTNNEDGTHTGICSLCGREIIADCQANEEGKCYFCGADCKGDDETEGEETEAVLVDPAICEHEFEYTFNEDGTHTYFCPLCGTEGIEKCKVSQSGFCALCGGYTEVEEEEELEYQTFSNTMAGVTVSVSGMLPQGCVVDIGATSPTFAENIINSNTPETVDALGAYHIEIYDKDGNEYQPCWDDNTVTVNISGLSGYDAGAVTVYRIEDDYSSVSTLSTNSSESNIICETGHFTIIAPTVSTEDETYWSTSNYIGYFETVTGVDSSSYKTVNSAEVYAYVAAGEAITGYAYLYKVSELKKISGTPIVSKVINVTNSGTTAGPVDVKVDFTQTSDGYFSNGDMYAVIFKFDGTANLYFGNKNDSGELNTDTYYSGSNTSYTLDGSHPDVIEVTTSDVAQSSLNDVSSVDLNVANRTVTVSGSTYAYFAKGESGTLTATVKNTSNATINRTVTYSVTGDTGSVSFNSSTGLITATAAGTITISATCCNVTNSIIVRSVNINLLDGNRNVFTPVYTGAKISPAEATIDVVDGTTTTTYKSTTTDIKVNAPSSTDINAGAGTITVPITVNGTTISLYDSVTIEPCTIKWSTSFASAEFTIESSSRAITAVTNVTNAATSDTLEWNVDYTATAKYIGPSNGDKYLITIAAKSSNYQVDTSDYSGYKIITNNSAVKGSLAVKWDDTSSTETTFDYDGKTKHDNETAITGKKWKFYDLNGNEVTGIDETETYATSDKDVNDDGYQITFNVTGYDNTDPLTLTYYINPINVADNANLVEAAWVDKDGTTLSSNPSFERTGSSIVLTDKTTNHIKVTDGYLGTTLEAKTGTSTTYDYEVSSDSNSAGNRTATIQFTGNYTGSLELNYLIEPSLALDALVKVGTESKANAVSNGEVKSKYSQVYKPGATSLTLPAITSFIVKNGTYSKTLTEQSDSTSTTDGFYIDTADTNADVTTGIGTKTLVIKGTGLYAGESIKVTFTVTAYPINAATVTMITNSFEYDGEEHKLTDSDLSVIAGGKQLTLDEDYEIKYTSSDLINAGTVTFSIVGINNYMNTFNDTDSKCKYTITQRNISSATAKFNPDTTTYACTGSAITPTVVVTYGSTTLVKDTDYTVTYSDNIAKTTTTTKAKALITGIGNYSGTLQLTFDITSKDASSFTYLVDGQQVKKAANGIFYTDKEYVFKNAWYTPSVTVYDGSTSVDIDSIDTTNNKNAASYDLSTGADNSKAPCITLVLSGINETAEPIKIYFTIKPKELTDSMNKTATSAAWVKDTDAKVTVSVEDGSTKLTEYTDYTVTWPDTDTDYRKATAVANYTITGKGNYSGTIKGTYTIGTDINDVVITMTNPVTDVGTTVTKSFTINYLGKKDGGTGDYYEPEFILATSGGTALTEDTDYTITRVGSKTDKTDIWNSYNGTNTVTVTITGTAGYYNGTDNTPRTLTYTITPVSLSTMATTKSEKEKSIAKFGVFTEPTGDNCEGTDYKYYYAAKELNISDNIALKYCYLETDSDGNASYTVLDTLSHDDKDFTAQCTDTAHKGLSENIFGKELGNYYVKFSATSEKYGNYTGSSSTLHIEIVAKPLGKALASDIKAKAGNTFFLDSDNATLCVYYTGKAITFTADDFVVTINGETLTYGTDYVISCESVNVTTDSDSMGKAYIYCTNATNANYASTSSAGYPIYFKIVQVGMDSGLVTAEVLGTHTYKGAAYNQASDFVLNVTYAGEKLVQDTDYEISGYGTNIYPGQGARDCTKVVADNTGNWVEIKGKSSKFSSSTTLRVPFTITLDLSSSYASVTLDKTGDTSYYETTETPVATVSYTYGGNTYTIDNSSVTNYTVNVSNKGTPGRQTVSVVGASDGSYLSDSTSGNSVCVSGTKKFTSIRFLLNLDNVSDEDISKYIYFKYGSNSFAYTGTAVDLRSDDYVEAGVVVVKPNDARIKTDYEYVCIASDLSTVGEKKLQLRGLAGSNYFVPNSSKSISYWVKYEINQSNVYLCLDANGKETTSVEYDGNEYVIDDGTQNRSSSVRISVYGKFGTADAIRISPTYVTLNCDSLIQAAGTYTLEIRPDYSEQSDYIMGDSTSRIYKTLVVKGKTFTDGTSEGSTGNIKIEMPQDASGNPISYTYTGSSIIPYPTVTDKNLNKVLTLDKDYTIKWDSNTNAGTAKITVTGKGSYDTTSVSTTFTIQKRTVSTEDTAFQFNITDATYGGDKTTAKPTVQVIFNGATLTEDKDYTLEAGTVMNAATRTEKASYKLDFTPSTNFTGTISGTYNINQFDLSGGSVLQVQTSVEYTGQTITTDKIAEALKLAIPDGTTNGVTLLPNYDYTFKLYDGSGNELTGAKDVAIYAIVATGKNNCTGELRIEFDITKRSLPKNWAANGNSGGSVTITVEDAAYNNGAEAKPKSIKIWDTGNLDSSYNQETGLVEGTDFEIVSYGNATAAAAGEYYTADSEVETKMDEYGNYLPTETSPYVVIQGIGNYESQPFKVAYNVGTNINTAVWALKDVAFEGLNETFTYNGASQIPAFKIKYTNDNGGTSEFKSYDIAVVAVGSENGNEVLTEDDSISAGSKRLIITGNEAYYGTLENRYRDDRYFVYTINHRNIQNGYSLKGDGTNYSKYFYEGSNEKVSTTTLKSGLTFKMDLPLLDATALSSLTNKENYTDYEDYYYFVYETKYDSASNTLKQQEPTVYVYDNGLATDSKLVDESNYNVVYKNSNSTSSSSGNQLSYAEITMTNNYTVDSSAVVFRVYYVIVSSNLDTAGFKVAFDGATNQFKWDAAGTKPKFTVSDGTKTLSYANGDYTYQYTDSNGTSDIYSPGHKKLTVTGAGNYSGSISLDYYIIADVSDCTIVTPKRNVTFDENDSTTYNAISADSNGNYDIGKQLLTGSAIKPEIELILLNGAGKGNNILLVEGEDYEYTTSSANNWKTSGTGVVTGDGKYEEKSDKTDVTKFYAGTIDTIVFDISLDASLVDVGNYQSTYTYSSLPIKPEFKLVAESTGQVIDEEDLPFTITYYRENSKSEWEEITDDEDFIDVGTIKASLQINMDGVEVDPKVATYSIVARDMSTCNMVYVQNQNYNGSRIEPIVSFYFTAYDGSFVYVNRDAIADDFIVDYSVAENIYPNNSEITRTNKFTVTPKESNTNYTGTRECTFAIKVGQPTALKCTANSNSSIDVTWNPNRYATGTEVYCYDANDKLIEKAKLTDTSYTFDNLNQAENYTIKAQSYMILDTDDDDINETYNSDLVSKTVRTATKGATFSAESTSTGKAVLTWVDGGNIDQYRIYRSTDNITFTKIASLPSSINSYSDSSLASGTTYYYYVEGWVLTGGKFASSAETTSSRLEVTVK